MNLSDLEVLEIPPLTLAFLGDAVWELYVRNEVVIKKGSKCRVNALHLEVSKLVKASSQAAVVKRLIDDFLEPEELEVVRRGRNARPGHVNKNNTRADYCTSTGFESLIGYLYLRGDEERLQKIMQKAYEEGMNTIS